VDWIDLARDADSRQTVVKKGTETVGVYKVRGMS
jgi:hypothetical protein